MQQSRTQYVTTRMLVALALAVASLVGLSSVAEAATCTTCHAAPGQTTDIRPVDAPYRNITTGGFRGSHAMHIPAATVDPNACTSCHGPGAATYDTKHRNGFINVTSATGVGYSKGTTFAQSGSRTLTLGTCSTASCHANPYGPGTVTTPVWSTAAANCTACHTTPIGATGPATGSHTTTTAHAVACTTCHAAGTTATTMPTANHNNGTIDIVNVGYPLAKAKGSAPATCSTASCHLNVYGVGSVTTPVWGTSASCNACHTVAIDATGPNTGSHAKHNDSTCTDCHAAGTTQITKPTTGHLDGNVTVTNGYPVTAKHAANSGYTGTCSTAACHADPYSAGLVTTPVWGTTGNGCAACHSGAGAFTVDGSPSTGSHAEHMALNNATCTQCHTGAVSGTTGGNTHTNGTIEVANSYSASPVTKHAIGTYSGTCSAASCHSDGKGIVPTPVWGSTAADSCAVCHGNPPVTSTHAPINTAFGTTYVAVGTCANCHVSTSLKSVTHMNGTTNMNATLTPSASSAHFRTSKVATYNAGGSTTSGWYKGTRYVMANMSTAYVSPSDTCADCHSPNNQGIRAEYAQNFHASNNRWKTSATRAWKFQGYSSNVTPDQVTTDGCVRCHTTQGYINYVSSNFTDLRAWGFREAGYTIAATAGAANNTNTVTSAVTCRACHTDATGSVRGVAAAKAYYNFSTTAAFGGKTKSGAVQYNDFKNSNVCIPCHSGRNSASNGPIFDKLATFTKYTSAAVNPGIPHGDNGLQAGLLDAKIGYKFGQTYTADASGNSHNTIGTGGSVATGTTSGPCVTCHMDNASGHRDHTTFTINMSTLPNVCSNCHTSGTTPMTGTVVSDAKTSLAASLKALAEIMIDEKLNFTGTPILSAAPSANTALNAGLSYGNYSGRGTTGTSKIRPGANSLKVKYPFDGKSTQFATVAGAIYNLKLLNQGDLGAFAHNPGYAKWLINQSIEAVRSKTTGVSGVSVATTSVADAISKLTPNSRISSTEIDLAGGYAGTGTSCTTCHGNPPASGTHIEIAVQPGTCSNCHSGATHNGTLEVNLNCSSCHGNPPSTQVFHTTGFTKYTHNQVTVTYTDCSQCHSTPATPAADGTHRDGKVEILTNANACSSCHSYPPATSAHNAAVGGTTPNCAGCHIGFSYSAATHNNGTLDVTTACDTCHGYPPLTSAQLAARTGGAYANAKVEDYVGGAGHHSTHLLATVSASEGFTPCLPCHPSGFHNQGNNVVAKANINVNDAADLTFRFDDSRSKRYTVATQSCSNVSCHYKPTPAWTVGL